MRHEWYEEKKPIEHSRFRFQGCRYDYRAVSSLHKQICCTSEKTSSSHLFALKRVFSDSYHVVL